jgi:hypothetical protein
MIDKVAGQLVVYGPLGVLCVILIFALLGLYRAKEKMSTDYQVQITKLQDQHRDEMRTMMERHIVKAETWNEKWSELSTKLYAVLDSLVKRRG